MGGGQRRVPPSEVLFGLEFQFLNRRPAFERVGRWVGGKIDVITPVVEVKSKTGI